MHEQRGGVQLDWKAKLECQMFKLEDYDKIEEEANGISSENHHLWRDVTATTCMLSKWLNFVLANNCNFMCCELASGGD